MSFNFHVLLLNGPNLNLLGIREPKKYGYITLSKIIERLIEKASKLKTKITCFQSNSENYLINSIHKAKTKNIDYILINPSAFTHTSIAMRDAFLSVNIPFIEIHISNIYSRESFRKNSYFSDIADGIICGLGTEGYFLALQAAIKKLSKISN